MQRASRHDLVRALAPRSGHVSKRERGQIVDQVCEVTGYTPKYPLMLLEHPPLASGNRVRFVRGSLPWTLCAVAR